MLILKHTHTNYELSCVSLDPVFKDLSAKRSTRRAHRCAYYVVVPSSPQTANVDTHMAEMEEKEKEEEEEEEAEDDDMMTNPWMAIAKDPLPSTTPRQSNRKVPKIPRIGCNHHHRNHNNRNSWSAAATEEKAGRGDHGDDDHGDDPIVLSPRVPHIIALPRTPRSHMATTT